MIFKWGKNILKKANIQKMIFKWKMSYIEGYLRIK